MKTTYEDIWNFNHRLGSITGDVEIVWGALKGNSVEYKGGQPIIGSYDKDGNLFFDDWLGAVWATGSETDKFLFFYYGHFQGSYRTGILKKK